MCVANLVATSLTAPTIETMETQQQERRNIHKKAPIEHIDYKDTDRLAAHTNPHARMMGRRRTGFSAKAQRDFARAIKRARFMALMPYIQR